jgi:hypothetical protein
VTYKFENLRFFLDKQKPELLPSFFENKTGLEQGNILSPIFFNLALQKVIPSIKLVPSGIKIGKEQLNILAYADDIVLIGKKGNRNKITFCRN